MTYDEALAEAVAGARVRCPTMLEGQYVEHMFNRGFVRAWPVDKVEEEPSRTQCDYIATADEQAAEWSELQRPKVDSWGNAIDLAFFKAMDEERAAPHVEVKAQRSKWGKVSSEAALIAIEQKKAKLNLSAFDPDIAAIAEMPEADFKAGLEAEKAKAWGSPARDSWGRPLG